MQGRDERKEPAIDSEGQSQTHQFLDIVRVMSHDVRTTLNAVLGYTGIILDKMLGDINPMQEQALKQVISSVRETLSVIEKVLDAAKAEFLKVDVLTGSRPLKGGLHEFEREVILKALQKTDFNQTKAAALLGLSRRMLHYRMDKLNISSNSPAGPEKQEEKG